MSQSASQSVNVPNPGASHAAETSPGGQTPAKWKIVAKTPGLAPAQIIAGRLQAEGLPVRAWQEAAGQAIGLTVGILGTGYVAVPAEYVSKAEAILNDSSADQGEAFDDQDNQDERS